MQLRVTQNDFSESYFDFDELETPLSMVEFHLLLIIGDYILTELNIEHWKSTILSAKKTEQVAN